MSSRPPMKSGNCSGFYGDRLSAMREMVVSRDRPPESPPRPEATTVIGSPTAMRWTAGCGAPNVTLTLLVSAMTKAI